MEEMGSYFTAFYRPAKFVILTGLDLTKDRVIMRINFLVETKIFNSSVWRQCSASAGFHPLSASDKTNQKPLWSAS